MKEAAGEANMTVIVIVLIGVLAAAGALFIPQLINNMKDRSCCTQNGGEVKGNQCVIGDTSNAIKGYYTTGGCS